MDGELIQKQFRLVIKAVNPDGTFEGYASVFSNIDSDGDVIDLGAFKRTIDHSKGVVPILWQHDRTTPIGWNLTAEEDPHGLKVKGQLLMDTDPGRYAYSFMSKGLEVGGKPGLSIGFLVPPNGAYYVGANRHFREVVLKEYSIVTFPANDQATVTSTKGVVPYQDLPLASDDMAWDRPAADGRVRSWAGGDDKDKIDWAKYRKAFLWFDAKNAKSFDGYRLQIADIVDGKLTAIPLGIVATAEVQVKSADIPKTDTLKVRSAIARYYQKMGRESPFKSEGEAPKMKMFFKADDFNSALQEAIALDSLNDLRWTMSGALSDAIYDICGDDTIALADKKTAIAESLNQYATAMASWWAKYLDITDDSAKQAKAATDKLIKEGRAVSAATQAKLNAVKTKAEGAIRESMGYSKMSAECKQKAITAISDLGDAYTWNDVNKPNPVGGGKAEGQDDPEILHSLLEAAKGVQQKLVTV